MTFDRHFAKSQNQTSSLEAFASRRFYPDAFRRVKRMRRIRRDVAESANNAHRTKQTETMWLADSEWEMAQHTENREQRKRKRLCAVNKSGSRREIIPLVIYIFHKYSLSWEKVEPEKGGWTS